MSYAILNTEYNELFIRGDEDDIAQFETKLEAFQEINRQCARNVEIWGMPFTDRYKLIPIEDIGLIPPMLAEYRGHDYGND